MEATLEALHFRARPGDSLGLMGAMMHPTFYGSGYVVGDNTTQQRLVLSLPLY